MTRMKPLQIVGLIFALAALVSLLTTNETKVTMSLMLIANVFSLLHWRREGKA